MGTQTLSPKKVRRLRRDTGLDITHAWSTPGSYWTARLRGGSYIYLAHDGSEVVPADDLLEDGRFSSQHGKTTADLDAEVPSICHGEE